MDQAQDRRIEYYYVGPQLHANVRGNERARYWFPKFTWHVSWGESSIWIDLRPRWERALPDDIQ